MSIILACGETNLGGGAISWFLGKSLSPSGLREEGNGREGMDGRVYRRGWKLELSREVGSFDQIHFFRER
jgi:hypothetical protein